MSPWGAGYKDFCIFVFSPFCTFFRCFNFLPHFFQDFKTHSKLILRRFGAIFGKVIFGNFGTIDFLCFWGAGGLPVGPRWSPEAPGRLLEMSIFSTFFDLLDRRWRSNGKALKREFEQKLLYIYIYNIYIYLYIYI